MAGVKTQGTQVYYRTGAASSYALALVKGITGLNFNAGTGQSIDVTDMDSAAVEKLAGIFDNGQLQIQLNKLPWNNAARAVQKAFTDLTSTDTVFVIGHSDGTDTPTIHATTGVLTLASTRSWWNFNASIVGTSKQANARDAIRMTTTAEISGSITETDKSA